jgi:nucleoside-diphosphate-sugar epimerase
VRRSPLPLPALAPQLPLQVIHEEDVGQAFLRCVVADGPPGAYNIAADGVLTTGQIAREVGLAPVPVPSRPVQAAARAAASLPFLPPMAEWVEAASHPAIMDCAKAKRELGWRPRWTGVATVRDTVHRDG